MKKIYSIVLLILLFAAGAKAEKFRTEAYSDRVKTLQVGLVDNLQAAPYITLEGENFVEVNFDILGNQSGIYTYTLTHCNADWTPSNIPQSDFMNGFQNRIIEDYALSLNATMNYVNYRISFPNEDIFLKASGNYAVLVFPENETEPILCACFSVVEPNVDIDLTVTSQTDRGMNNFFQQVGFTVKCGDLVKNPMNDLKVFVRQNERTDNEAVMVKPLHIQNRLLTYEHNPALIFEAGNEYRKFEMTTRRFNGLHIYSTDFHDPYFHVTVEPDLPRGNRSYSYDEDIDGQIFIRTLEGTEYDYEADYYIVHFFVPAEKPFAEDLYILSQAFNNILDERTKMEYSAADGGYVKSAVLKEGYYNYMYVARKNASAPASPAIMEGNFYQAENEYRALVYFRRAGDRFDRLIGTQTLKFR